MKKNINSAIICLVNREKISFSISNPYYHRSEYPESKFVIYNFTVLRIEEMC